MERIQKVLLHEQRTGYEDRATVGGLLPFWRQQSSRDDASPIARQFLAATEAYLRAYSTLAGDQRRVLINRLLSDLAAAPGPTAPPAPATRPAHGAAVAAITRTPSTAKTPPSRPPGPAGGVRRATAIPSTASQPRRASQEAPREQRAQPVGQNAPVQHRPQTGGQEVSRRPAALAAHIAVPKKVAVPSLSPRAPVTELPGVGPKAAAALDRLGVHAVIDLLYHLPRRHLDRRSITPIADLVPGQVATIYCTVWRVQVKRTPGQGRLLAEAILQDDSGFCHAIWFNQPYMARALSRPGSVVFSGKVEHGTQGGVQLIAPEFEFDSGDLLHTGRLVPFYPKTEGLTDKQLRTWVRLCLEAVAERLAEPLPPEVRTEETLPGLRHALAQAHFPDSDDGLRDALRRLAFDEFLLIQLGVLARRREWQESQPGLTMVPPAATVQSFLEQLPFALTGAQRRVLDQILDDMARPIPMSRLLQGEVGSGKTVVAGGACLAAVSCGHQAAVMVPTEVLAQQHYRSLSRLLAPFGVRVGMVVGSQKRKEKSQTWEAARTGELDVIIGTHALIQDDAEFLSLGLVVVDEQHRFGVRQRSALRGKGFNPDVLVMTATPIPRTLALSVYGDLDISVIDELPPGRQKIQTILIAPDGRHRAYEFLRRQVRASRQGFIICPLVEESDKIEARAATAEYERLVRQFPDLRLALLHGRMATKEKEAVMAAFRDGASDVLVSTAVVEVGIDVPNATVMLIEGADRFGLAQLHQFRGRVGRGAHQSYCLLLSDAASASENERLQALVENHDGFALAEVDLQLRGPGEFFGTRQSGLPDLKVARLSDVAVLEAARRQAQRIMADDPLLGDPRHALLATLVQQFWQTGLAERA